MSGAGVDGHAIRLSTAVSVMGATDSLVRALRAHLFDLPLQAKGKIPEPKGLPVLMALPAVAGSYAVPIAYEPKKGEQVVLAPGDDAVAVAADLLHLPIDELVVRLLSLPERIGKEVRDLYGACVKGDIDLAFCVVSGGHVATKVDVSQSKAVDSFNRLNDESIVSRSSEEIVGVLFRLDSEEWTATVRPALDEDVDEDAGRPASVKFSFPEAEIEAYKRAVRHMVRVTLVTDHAKRPYEREARPIGHTAESLIDLEVDH